MTPKSSKWTYWLAVGLLAVVSATLTVGWWLEHRAQSERLRILENRLQTLSSQDSEVEALRSRINDLSTQDSDESLREQNDDLTRFIDEAYTLLYEAGFHIQLDLEVDPDGRARLTTDSAKLSEELKAKLQELNQQNGAAPRQ